MRSSHTPPADGGQRQSDAEAELLVGLVLANLLSLVSGMPTPPRGAAFDAAVLVQAHRAGQITLQPEILAAAGRLARGETPLPNRAQRREIDALARKLAAKFDEKIRAMPGGLFGDEEDAS
jgi:hypothetical protein